MGCLNKDCERFELGANDLCCRCYAEGSLEVLRCFCNDIDAAFICDPRTCVDSLADHPHRQRMSELILRIGRARGEIEMLLMREVSV